MTSKYLTKKPFLVILIRSYMQILLASVPVIFSNRKKKNKTNKNKNNNRRVNFPEIISWEKKSRI